MWVIRKTLGRRAPIMSFYTGNVRNIRSTSRACLDSRRHVHHESSSLRVAVLGDLHLSSKEMPDYFEPARADIVNALKGNSSTDRKNFIVQLGDLGAYESNPGSKACFEYARAYLDSFCGEKTLSDSNDINSEERKMGVSTVTLSSKTGRPLMILGNHDLEGAEFVSDSDNLQCWKESFEQDHYWLEEHGDWLLIGLSTVRFRSNANSCHEVFVDKEQRDWLESTLDRYKTLQQRDGRKRRAVIFSHAPPAGSGLKVVHNVHVKNRCAWLNHSDGEGLKFFMELISRKGDMIALWFNGHFHLSHNYYDSISVVGETAFVQTGVIGSCHRDGKRQSRLLDLYEDGYTVSTIDHNERFIRVDMDHSFQSGQPVPHLNDKECYFPNYEHGEARDVFVDDYSADFLMRSINSCSILPSKRQREVSDSTSWKSVWHSTGVSELYVNIEDDVIVEYDSVLLSPIGVVHNRIGNRSVRLVDMNGNVVNTSVGEIGTAAVAVELYNDSGVVEERVERNANKYFYKIFQKNKWRKKLEEEKNLNISESVGK